MSDARQAGLGVLAALLSAVVIFGSMLLALTEGGQLVAMLPTLTAPSSGLQPFTPVAEESTPATLPPTETATPAVGGNCTPPEGWIEIEIPPGATVDDLAAAYGTTPQLIMEKNCLDSATIWDGYFLFVPASASVATATQTATSPAPTSTRVPSIVRATATCSPPPRAWVPYFVRRGDTLYAISRTFGISLPQLKAANCLRSSLIRVGQRLYVPYVPTATLPPASATPRPSATPTTPGITIIPPNNTATPTRAISPSPTQTPEPPTVTPTPTLPPPPTATETSIPFPTPMTDPSATVTSGPVP